MLRAASASTLLFALVASAQPATTARKLPTIPGTGRVSVEAIDETVDPGLAAFLGRVLSEGREGETVLVEINTLGGRLDSALAIRDALLKAEATSVCWVKPRAISAGALITLACDVVVVARGATIGAATPVKLTMTGDSEQVEEKVLSYMRQEMATTATAQSRPPLVAEAMVDPDVEIEGLDEKGKLLTLDDRGALAWGIADFEASTEAELWKQLGRDAPSIERPRPSAAEQLARFLSAPTVTTILLLLGLFGLAFEFFHPTHGAALLGGLFCLGLFFFGHLVVNLAGWEELAIVAVGALFLTIEYLIPGNTLFGAIGLKLILLGLFLALVDLENMPVGVAWEGGWIPRALATVFGGVLGAVALGVLAFRLLPATPLGKGLVLDAVVATPPTTTDPRTMVVDAMLGQVGLAITDLRPMGRVQVMNKKVEAQMEVGFASAGAKVRVVRIQGDRIIVREESAG
jgi:membrane-bound serine protease (ClpP class)